MEPQYCVYWMANGVVQGDFTSAVHGGNIQAGTLIKCSKAWSPEFWGSAVQANKRLKKLQTLSLNDILA